jgi:hypothetical protein
MKEIENDPALRASGTIVEVQQKSAAAISLSAAFSGLARLVEITAGWT